MSADIIPFDFEEQAVRVVMRNGNPWFVAADVCRVLDMGNPTETLKRLDNDEVTLSTIEGSHRPTNLISESGLYALVLTSRKEAARRFRKWITAEVLPALRRHGRYEMSPSAANDDAAPENYTAAMSPRDWLALVREARILGGNSAGRRMWRLSPLPALDAAGLTSQPIATEADGRASWEALMARVIDGRSVEALIQAERYGDLGAAQSLAAEGMRLTDEGLFLANHAAGALRSAYLAMPGAYVHPGCRTLLGRTTRGIVLPVEV